MACDICVCHSTTLVVRWSSKVTNQLTASLTRQVDSWLSTMRHPCPSLHTQHVPLTVYFNFVGHRPATSIYLSNQSTFPTPSFVSWPGTCSWTTLLFCYLTVLSPTYLHECLSLVQCVTTLLSEAMGCISSFFSLTFSFRQQIVIVKYSFWIPLSSDACCIPLVSILLTSSLYQQCVTMWSGLPQLYSIRIKDDGLGFYFIFFHFFFIFSYFFLLKSRRQRRQSVTWSQKSHTHMIQGNNVEGSRKMTS